MRHNFLTKKDFSCQHQIIIRASLIQVVPEVHKTLRHLLICKTIRSQDRGTLKMHRSLDLVKISITRTSSSLLRLTILALMFQWASQMSMWVCLSNNNIRNKSQLKCLNNIVHKVLMIDRSTRVVLIISMPMKRLIKIMKKQRSLTRTGTFYKM